MAGAPRAFPLSPRRSDLYGVYAEFFQGAVADYQGELEEITKLGKTLADDALQAMQTRSERPRSEGRLN